MSDDFHERTSIMAIAQWIGMVIAPWFWVIIHPDWFLDGAVATRTLAVWVGIPCMIL
jgi:GPH family glycoside/pentoside/hexuronide:cation symporter